MLVDADKLVGLAGLDQIYPDRTKAKQALWRMARLKILPPGVVVRVGRRMLFNVDKFREWVEAGGTALPGGWRHEPQQVAGGGGAR